MSKPPGEAAAGQKPDLDAIARMRAEHARWLESDGADGARADFSGMELSDVRFPGADLSRARFADANLFRADFAGADLSEADFTGANLNRADLAGSTLQGAVLDKTDLSDAALGDARMEHASLVEASLQRAWLGRAHLEHATLTRADLHGTWAGRASFEQANLEGAMLVGAEFPGTSFRNASLRSAYFGGRGPGGRRSLRRRIWARYATSRWRSSRRRRSTSGPSCRRSSTFAAAGRLLRGDAGERENHGAASPARRQQRTEWREDSVTKLRVAVDIGGTFTDICILDEGSGALRVAKTASTPEDPLIGAMRGLEEAEVSLRDVTLFSHGTTVATNALITRRLPPAAMICTEGYRDVIEIRRSNKEDLWTPTTTWPSPTSGGATDSPCASASTTEAGWRPRSTNPTRARRPGSCASGASAPSPSAS